jgi:nucleoside-diphosphate-sugar epimerase
MNILVTGGCGYIGTILIKKLLDLGYKVISIDTQWFGNYLPRHKNLKNLKLDIRDIEKLSLKNIDSIIHLASISNDPMAEVDKNLSWETSVLGTELLMRQAMKYKIKRIIYASSGSVYGIKKEKKVHEKLSLKPISLYNKVKMSTERVILSYKNKIDVFILRPATVCGFSPRMRLDVTVNVLTFSALKKKIIKVFGGSQIRPNVHIDDMVNAYVFFLKAKKKLQGIYNIGFENKSILKIAKCIKKIINSKIDIVPNNNDPRSYRLDSTKIIKIGFKPKKTIENAIEELKKCYEKKILKDRKSYHSTKWLKHAISKR